MKKIIIYVDMDDVLCDFTGARLKALEKCPDIKYPQSQYGFFRNLMPIQGGVDAIKYLDSIEIFSVYILTAPSLKNPLCYTEKRMWVEDHLGFDMVDKLIISPHKGLNKGDYLIDDYEAGRGQEYFEGELIQFASKKFSNWQKVLDFFNKKYSLL